CLSTVAWRGVSAQCTKSNGNGGVPVTAERRPRVRPPVLHAAQQGARTPPQILQQLLVVRTRWVGRAQPRDPARRRPEADTPSHTAAQLQGLSCQDQPGDRRALQRWCTHAALHADLRSGGAVTQEVLRAQRHLPLP
ncbi:unnamed protein product, partial [Leptidea sinapis]